METPSSINVSTKLERIAKQAREAPEMAFQTLAHHITWFYREVIPRLLGTVQLFRYADDAVLLLGEERDAKFVNTDPLPLLQNSTPRIK